MPEFGLWLFALVVICHPLVPWATGLGSSAAPEGPEEAGPLSRQPGTVDRMKFSHWRLCLWWKVSKPSYIFCVHASPLQVTASAQRRCPGRRHSPATLRSRARSTSSRCRWAAATPSATARGWCNDSWGCRHTDTWAWSLPPGPGAAGPSAPSICRENWRPPAPAGAPPMWEPGEAASPKQRLSLYLFILPFLLLICWERRGLGVGGRE